MDKYTSLQGKVALVTGGGSGIGQASALFLAKQGVKVCLVDIKEEAAKETQKAIEAIDGEAFIVEADVSNPKEVFTAFEAVIDQYNRLDIVFANAGINGTVAPIEDLEPEEWDKTISTNLKSTFLTFKYAIPHLKQNGGSIILTSSINGNRVFSNFGMSAYSSTKAGQMAFGKMAALELANYRIRVNIICPGAIETNIGENTEPKNDKLNKVRIPIEYPEGSQPLEHRSGTPEQVASLVAFLASDASSHITGTELFIDGAESLL